MVLQIDNGKLLGGIIHTKNGFHWFLKLIMAHVSFFPLRMNIVKLNVVKYLNKIFFLRDEFDTVILIISDANSRRQ